MVVDHRKKLCGRKKKDYSEALLRMSSIPVSKRTSVRATAHALGVSCHAVHTMTKSKEIN